MAETHLTFADHIHELRKRLMWSLLFVAIGAGVGYVLHDTILSILQQPLNEKLYYTTPTGAFSFIIKICCVFGFVVALPVVVYQAFAFFEPLVSLKTRRSLVGHVLLSVLLAATGITFAYFISLPAALHFLVNFGSDGGNIQALITANEYFNFVLAYIAGFAVLFQLPLIISFINRAKPLKPSQLIGGTRYVILGSFIISAVITPTPDPLNQALMAGPIIILYFVSVLVVAVTNGIRRRRYRPAVPDMPTAGIEALLSDTEPVAVPAAPLQLRPAQVASVTPIVRAAARPMRRTIDGMLVPARRAPVTVVQRPQPIQQSALQSSQPTRPSVRGVISDFVPVTE
ncbi:MAG TPA: twin-arginine translocase subunit TatC [Verrucomicrobiae bacterium]|nr:twin-arginine translocase subunit TatC [Verrucomicrobiae bacterium]